MLTSLAIEAMCTDFLPCGCNAKKSDTREKSDENKQASDDDTIASDGNGS